LTFFKIKIKEVRIEKSFHFFLLVMILYGSGMAMTLASAPPMVSELVTKKSTERH
jgi:hypothetical protein